MNDFEKKLRINHIVGNLKRNHSRLQNTVLKLMAHPDATPEQVSEAHRCMVDVQQKIETVLQMANRLPPRSYETLKSMSAKHRKEENNE